jgi:predicted nucleotide-binding protein
MTLDLKEAVDALRKTADGLGAEVADAERPDVVGPLDRLQDAATKVGKAWSGSWFGYHSRVYYKDFQPPPAGAMFSPEWGFMSASSNPTKGDWIELSFDEVVDVIEELAGRPDLTQADLAGDNARRVFDESRAEIVSVITAVTASHPDELLSNLLDEAKSLSPLSRAQAVRLFLPSGQLSSRDAAAITQGTQAAPHHTVLGRVLSARDPISNCTKLEKISRRAASHLERLTGMETPRELGDRVFIGHGRSPLWRELKDFIQDRLALPWDEFNRVPVAGVTNVARLAEMLSVAAIAFLVLTAEDEDRDGGVHARLNVIHEAGLFQGRLGFSRAIVLLEEGCEEFSNIEGLGQIRFPKGNIAAAFEEVRRVLEREGLAEEG